MIKQRTLSESFSLSGKGIHTGEQTRITFNPAPDNYGYKIKRTDISGFSIIDAVVENVVETQRGITLEQNGVRVSSVEHALAALYGCEIDNCLIEIDGAEFPILDGSAIKYGSAIKKCGVRQQSAPRKYIAMKRKKIRIVDMQTNSSLILVPDDSLKIKLDIAYNSPLLKRQSATLDNLCDFPKEIASARTFAFVKEIELLHANDLIRGGDLNNAIILYDSLLSQADFDHMADLIGVKKRKADVIGYIMNKPLTYPNEPARHKLLDLLGDLALTGAFIKGAITATCPGHKINTRFVAAIREYYLKTVFGKNEKIAKKHQILHTASNSHLYSNHP